jgi:hypothetical protein
LAVGEASLFAPASLPLPEPASGKLPPLLDPLLEPELLPLELPLLDPLLDPLPLELLPEPPELLLPPGWTPPMHALTVTVVSCGAVAMHVVPTGHPCDESQNCAQAPLMQTSLSPHEADPCVSAHGWPAPAEPLVMQAYWSGPASQQVCPPPHWKGSSLQGCDEQAAATASAPTANSVTKTETVFGDFMIAGSYHRERAEHERAHTSCARLQ